MWSALGVVLIVVGVAGFLYAIDDAEPVQRPFIDPSKFIWPSVVCAGAGFAVLVWRCAAWFAWRIAH